MHEVRPNSFSATAAGLADVPAVILCGGLGTRLRSTVFDRPKGLAPVAGRPFLQYLLGQLRFAGIRQVTLCIGYKAEIVRATFGDGAALGLALTYAEEREPLGTAGALKHAESYVTRSPFLMFNGDSICAVDVAALVAAHGARRASATLALVRVNSCGRYGSVWLDDAGGVTGFHEKCAGDSGVASDEPGWINAGVYVFGRKIFSAIPPVPPAVSLETEILPRLVGRGLYGFASEGYFIDIGIPEDFARAQEELPRRFGHVFSHSR